MSMLRLRASLEEAIQAWADKECEGTDWTSVQVWWPDSLTSRMAEAAYCVMMANAEGQKFAEEQGK